MNSATEQLALTVDPKSLLHLCSAKTPGSPGSFRLTNLLLISSIPYHITSTDKVKMRENLADPTRNSFRNLIDFVATGEDVPLEEEGGANESGENKKKEKKKKKKEAKEEVEVEEEEGKKKRDKKKKDKKKDKKKKKKRKESEEGDDHSDLDMDSDDDLSLGSLPSSSDDEEDDQEASSNAGGGGISRQVSKRASIAEGLKGFQAELQKLHPSPSGQQPKSNSQRRHTLGAALKGFQVDVKSDSNDTSDLAKNLPKLSLAGVRQNSRRQSSFDVFLKNASSKNKEESK